MSLFSTFYSPIPIFCCTDFAKQGIALLIFHQVRKIPSIFLYKRWLECLFPRLSMLVFFGSRLFDCVSFCFLSCDFSVCSALTTASAVSFFSIMRFCPCPLDRVGYCSREFNRKSRVCWLPRFLCIFLYFA